KFLQDSELVKRLKVLQRDHFESVLEANWDDRFVQRRRRVGQVHAERGIGHLYFLGAYYKFFEHILQRMGDENQGDMLQNRENLASLLKAVFLDIGLTLESYFSRLSRNLRQALDIIWQANNQLRQFARLASHDLKTPLGTVANLCEEVLDEFGNDLPDESAELIQAARRTVFDMSETIDELLSSILDPNAESSDDETSSEEIIREAVERIRPELTKKEIVVTLPSGMPDVRGNKVQLREAFYNLFSNAEKYIDKRPGRIEVGFEIRDADCIFSIADNGPGIPEEKLDQIFSAFYRLSQNHNQPGSGLGLYFTKNLIEQQGGKIWAESQPGQGSCFYIQLKRSSLETNVDALGGSE
ncbi:MAG: hypothetical protein IH899_21200, partial [Planctomycetes bacterium]|nr:hypothetical protein [Planctomycetota bacterium]